MYTHLDHKYNQVFESIGMKLTALPLPEDHDDHRSLNFKPWAMIYS